MSCLFVYIIKEPMDKDIVEEQDENLNSFVTETTTTEAISTTTTFSKSWLLPLKMVKLT